MSAKKATPQKPAAPITSFFTKAPSPSQQQATTGQAAKGAAMAEAATVGVKLNFERPAANEPSNKDSRSPLRTLLPSAPPTEPKSASGASRRVDAEGGPSEETSTRDPPVAATAEGSPVSASVGDAHFMTPAHALRGPQDEDATPGDTPATVRIERRPLNRGTPKRSVTAFQKSRPESFESRPDWGSIRPFIHVPKPVT